MNVVLPDWYDDYHLLIFDEVDSTNEVAKRLAYENVEGSFLIWAKNQRQGRGRYGREWVSSEGNLFMSLLLKPECNLLSASQLSFVAAIAVKDAIADFKDTPIDLGCKWPNDILLDAKKVGGILLESSMAATIRSPLDWLVIGIGINICTFPDNINYPATCLESEGFKDIRPDQLVDAIMRNFTVRLQEWQQKGFSSTRKIWLESAVNLGKAITVRTEKDRISGVFDDIDEDGCLVLTLAGGQRCLISAGEVFFGGLQ